MRWSIPLLLCAALAHAEGEQAGDFDYYVLALSWAPSYCALEGDARGDPQCEDGAGRGWLLHGLWPQYETGWPSYCRGDARNPGRTDTAAMADLMGSAGSAWHQWNKHGRCAGLTSEDYFALSRLAYDRVNRPAILRRLDRAVTLPAAVIEEAFLQANPGWHADMLTVTCRAGRIQEARLCLSRDLVPRPCGRDVVRDCTASDALFEPVR